MGKRVEKYIVKTPDEMQRLGASLADTLSGGDIILLDGELGAGKTVFCKGLAKGLGITATVLSPTFTLMNEYFGRVKFCHFDAYRLADEDEAIGAGLSDFFGASDRICAVEWWENIAGLFDGYDTVKIGIVKLGDHREVTVER